MDNTALHASDFCLRRLCVHGLSYQKGDKCGVSGTIDLGWLQG